MTSHDALMLVASMLRAGNCSVAEQKALSNKVSQIAAAVQRIEIALDEIAADAAEEAMYLELVKPAPRPALRVVK